MQNVVRVNEGLIVLEQLREQDPGDMTITRPRGNG